MDKHKFLSGSTSKKFSEHAVQVVAESAKASDSTQSWEPRPSAYNLDLVESMRQSQEFEATFRFADRLLRQG